MTIVAKFAGRCEVCGGDVPAGARVEWDPTSRKIRHEGCVKAEPEPTRRFQPTPEQLNALRLFATGKNLAIEAGAGTGKTATLQLLAESTGRRGQYIAFNKAIVEESKMRMPKTVACSTAHSLAYRAVGSQYAERLRSSKRMRSMDIALRLGLDPYRLDGKTISASFLGGWIMSGIIRFCQTADPEPDARHLPYIEGIDLVVDGERQYHNNNRVAAAHVDALRRAWADLMDENGVLPFRHDHYLKAWQLSGPRIAADYILFDEAQDANPVMVAIVAAQTHAQLVWVGDSQQQIYSFTGAVNALAQVPADNRAFLTQSFRFGPEIAAQANLVLDTLDADLRIVGTPTIESAVTPVPEPDAILTRTNATAVRTVLRLQQEGFRVALVGGGDEVVRFARGAQELKLAGHTDHPELACFESWDEVQRYVQEDQLGNELELMVKLVDDFGVETILAALAQTIREDEADVIVSTAHKSKGREWDRVQLGDDFPPENPSDEELRLLYVAVTRAKLRLDVDAVAVFALPGGLRDRECDGSLS